MTASLDQHERLAVAQRDLERVATDPSVLNLLTAYRRRDELAEAVGARPVRLAILPSMTFEPLIPALVVRGLHADMRIDSWIAPFDQISPTLLAADGDLTAFKPDVVLLALRVRDQLPQLYDGIPTDQAAAVFDAADHWLATLQGALQSFTSRHAVPVLLQGLPAPTFIADGPVDAHRSDGQFALYLKLSQGLRAIADEIPSVQVLDIQSLVARHGAQHLFDERMDAFGRLPLHANHYWDYAGFIVRHIRPLVGLTKKLIVVDADNTLWGGIVGDDGPDGIQIGQDYPGNAFQAFQRRLLALRDRGVILCLASKNEPGAVEAVLDTHPDMILRREHFSALAVNWQPKPENLRNMANALNLGLDSFVFIDDSEVECELMRTSLPQVTTIQLSKEPASHAGVLEALDCFDQFALSNEDRQRADLYRAEGERRQLQSQTLDMESFYRSLQMRLAIGVNDEAAVTRAAQMTNRTNQFNMTTVRCSEAQVRALMQTPDVAVVTARLHDRFGDNGLVGLAVVRRDRADAVIEQFLFSCRVLGRTVEKNFLAWIAAHAKIAGATHLIGCYSPTAKNKPFGGFYDEMGFAPSDDSDDVSRWRLSLNEGGLPIDEWISIEVATGEQSGEQ